MVLCSIVIVEGLDSSREPHRVLQAGVWRPEFELFDVSMYIGASRLVLLVPVCIAALDLADFDVPCPSCGGVGKREGQGCRVARDRPNVDVD